MSGRKDEVTEKIPEPFEFFAFLEKPFAQKQLIEGIRQAKIGAEKLRRYMDKTPSVTEVPFSPQDTSAMAAEMATLKNKVTHMEAEIVHLKKQLHQIVNFIKQKLK
jgi:hypothetical protein